MRYKNKVVLVTGATHNTGLSIAEAFAKEGAIIALNGLKAEDVVAKAAHLRSKFGVTVHEAVADVAVQADVDAMFVGIKDTYGRLDVLVNNAIIQGVGYSFTETPRELLEDVFKVNVFGTFACAQGAARIMLETGSGAIVNIGSNSAERAIKDRSAYIASKGATDAFTRAMVVDLGRQGIRVNTVVAGYINSDRWDVLPDETVQRRRKNVPLGQEARGSDIADAVLFLASDAACKITGTRLVVDGGISTQLIPVDCDG